MIFEHDAYRHQTSQFHLRRTMVCNRHVLNIARQLDSRLDLSSLQLLKCNFPPRKKLGKLLIDVNIAPRSTWSCR